jgi:pantoate--beta-alanine ligase
MGTPLTLITPQELAAVRGGWAEAGARVAFVPTMGALHQGHLSLVQRARTLADRVLVSVFVNPLQFGPSEDFAKYPRTLKGDLELLESQGVEAVFLPNAAGMYPDGFQTYVHNKAMAATLDGLSRPGHFEGVLTVVLKLFMLTRPQFAIFGKKDYQQWRLVERMAQDLCLPLEIVGAETLREPDGLAMSSRNRYLGDTERPLAAKLHQGLAAAQAAFKAGSRDAGNLVAAFKRVADGVQGLALEYAELRRQRDLTPFAAKVDAPCVLLCAARLGATRLIDNLELD